MSADREPGGIRVKRPRAEDAALAVQAVRLLKAPAGYPTPSVEYLSAFLDRPDNVVLIALEGDVPVGYILAYLLDRIDREQPMMLLYEIGVGEPHRRRGIGKKLIAGLKRVCRAHDVVKMWVPTDRSNIAAARLYASTGAVRNETNAEITYVYSRQSLSDNPDFDG